MDRHGQVCRTDGHPQGSAITPTFTVINDIAYSTGHGTTGAAGLAWFTIVGSMVYPALGHPFGESDIPRYQVRG